MRMYKIAAAPTFPMLQQNVNQSADPNITKQNLVQAQNAIRYLKNVIPALTASVQELVKNMEDLTGVNIGNQINQVLFQALSQSNVFQFLVHMGYLQNPEQLFQSDQIQRIEQTVITNIQSGGMAPPTSQPQTQPQV